LNSRIEKLQDAGICCDRRVR